MTRVEICVRISELKKLSYQLMLSLHFKQMNIIWKNKICNAQGKDSKAIKTRNCKSIVKYECVGNIAKYKT